MKRIVISEEGRINICTRDSQENVNQKERELEDELLRILISQGYEYRDDIKNEETLKNNLKRQLETLNRHRKKDFSFSPSE